MSAGLSIDFVYCCHGSSHGYVLMCCSCGMQLMGLRIRVDEQNVGYTIQRNVMAL